MNIRKYQEADHSVYRFDNFLKDVEELTEVLSLLIEDGYGDYPIFMSGYGGEDGYDYVTVPLIDCEFSQVNYLSLMYDDNMETSDILSRGFKTVEGQITVNKLNDIIMTEVENSSSRVMNVKVAVDEITGYNFEKYYRFDALTVKDGVVNFETEY